MKSRGKNLKINCVLTYKFSLLVAIILFCLEYQNAQIVPQ
jgi:hypothetical protein